MAAPSFKYRTIETSGESMYRVMASKHLGFACHVRSEAEIKGLLEEWWKEHHNANHICYAWRLGWDKQRYRINDDGEPSGTAGKPIYGQILAADLTNVLVAVVRYFGGTKLGTGGLIDAYKTASAQAILSAVICEREALQQIDLEFTYERMPAVMKMLKQWDMEKLDAHMDAICTLKIALTGSHKADFETWAADQEDIKYQKGTFY
jgi:uncharacterized YigZ family protein